MFFIDLLIALIIALLLSLLLVPILGREHPSCEGPWAAMFFLFLVLFFGTWAIGVWIVPFGPIFWEVHFLPYIFIGLVFAFLLAAALPPRASKTLKEEEEHVKSENVETVTAAFGLFFWVLIILFMIAIIMKYTI